MSVTLSLNEALDIFSENESEIVAACQINIMHSIRTHQPAAEIADSWTKDDILKEVNRLFIAKETAPMIKVVNAITRRNAPVVYGQITDEMIEKAREYPVDELLEFRKGVTMCLWHNDTNPSLYHYKNNNRVHCFVCEKNASSIDIVMEQDKCSFPQAVKRLAK